MTSREPQLRQVVQDKLKEECGPAQITAHLRATYRNRPGWHLCHETIYQALAHSSPPRNTDRMTASTEIAVLITDPQEAAAFADEVVTLTGEKPLIVDRRGIDGATSAGLLVMVTTVVQTLPAILDSITRLLQRNTVGEIELTDDGIRITNPRRQDIDDLRERYTGDREGAPDAR